MPARTPLSIVTGYLGSGKTTLLSHILSAPDNARTAVLLNDFGEIGLDDALIAHQDEQIIELSNGCICCSIQEDLVTSLGGLLHQRDTGAVSRFERVMIETTGLANPVPIMHTALSYPYLAEAFVLDAVLTTVDAVNGPETLQRHRESLRQVAVADRLLITKTDLPEAQTPSLYKQLDRLNAGAQRLTVDHGKVDPSKLFFQDAETQTGNKALDIQQKSPTSTAEHDHDHDHIGENIYSFSIVRERPIPGAAFTNFLHELARLRGPQLLRVKGIINIAERPGTPAVFHGVQNVFHPAEWLDSWPNEDTSTRIVFITDNLPREDVEASLDLLTPAR